MLMVPEVDVGSRQWKEITANGIFEVQGFPSKKGCLGEDRKEC